MFETNKYALWRAFEMRHIVGYAVSDSAFSGQQQLQGKSEGRDRPRTHSRVSGVTTTFKYVCSDCQRHTATWSHSFSMESWRLPVARVTVTVSDGMWACQAMRVKQQKLRIAQLYANEQRISRVTTNRSEETVSGAHMSPSRVHAKQGGFPEQSHGFKWFDCNDMKMMRGK